jgi:fructokinase
MSKRATCFGEILWDVLPSGELPGGAPMNVAYHLHKLGIKTNIITRIGKDDHGERLLALLRSQGVDITSVQVDDKHQTGLVQATVGLDNEVSYDIIAPVAWDHIELQENLHAVVAASDYFIFGSLAHATMFQRKHYSVYLNQHKQKCWI